MVGPVPIQRERPSRRDVWPGPCTLGGAEVQMPYASNQDLPATVRAHLPEHAQDIYRAAFNDAWEHRGEDAAAHRIAWGAVKHQYVKTDRGWVPIVPPVEPPPYVRSL